MTKSEARAALEAIPQDVACKLVKSGNFCVVDNEIIRRIDNMYELDVSGCKTLEDLWKVTK